VIEPGKRVGETGGEMVLRAIGTDMREGGGGEAGDGENDEALHDVSSGF
jgi:hypothetical protein